ncbi:MAG TPA: hypothetical protein VE569_11775, partial [Acidimicrobiia bacterium]|nr:hypothetical protein [Acidimicrobiia bacterium]
MEVEKFDDPKGFRRVADPLLLADEAANNLILGVSGDAAGARPPYETFVGWVVRETDTIVAAAAQTPPHNLILARSESKGAIETLAAVIEDIPGVVGTVPEVETFVAHHPERQRTIRQGIYRLTQVRVSLDPDGCRRATDSDNELLIDWMLD